MALATTAYESHVLGNSPVAYWPLGESSGDFTDLANSNTATANGTITYGNTGPIYSDSTTAISLDGSSAYAEASDSTSLDSPTSDITLEGWVDPTSGQFGNGNWRMLVMKASPTFSNPYMQYALGLNDASGNPNSVLLGLAIGGNFTTLAANNAGWSYGQWNHIVGTYDGSSMRIYVNGQQVAYQAEAGSIATYSTPTDLGAYPNYAHDSSVLLEGGLAQVAIYSSALTASQVDSDYAYAYAAEGGASSGTSGYTVAVNHDNPSAYWRLDESAGPYLRDQTSNHNDAVVSNSGISFTQTSALESDSNSSLSLDGSSGYASAQDSSSLNPTSAITVEAWANPTAGQFVEGNYRYIVQKSYTSWVLEPYLQYGIALNDYGSNPKAVYFGVSIGGVVQTLVVNNAGWSYGAWNHIVGTYDGSNLKIYVNGVLVGSQAQTGSIDTYPTPVGLGSYMALPKTSTYLYKGGIDDVAIYPAALSATRVRAHYLASGNTPEPTGGAPSAAELRGGGVNFCLVCTIAGIARGVATSHPIDTENGNFYHDFVDFNIPGRSYPLAITRTYNSDAASVDGPFGYGWNYNYGSSLAVTGTSPNEVATITQENGSQVSFDEPASGSVWTPAASRYNATLTYNSGSSTWTFVRQAKDTYTFNSSGQLTQEEDLNGYTTSLSYTSGDLTTVTDPAGRTLTLSWTGSHVTSITDANVTPNRTVSYSYDGSGNLEDVTDVNGGDTHFAYDGSHRMTTMKDPVCEAAVSPSCPGVQNHYDGSGRVDWQKDQLNRETTFSYTGSPDTASGGTTLTTDPASNETLDTYQWGVRTAETKGYGTAAAATTSFVYDPGTLALTGTMDANGNVTAYTVDGSGNILTKTDPLGRVTTNTYNGFNEVLTTEDGNGVTTTNTYDGNGNLTSTKTPLVGSSPLVYQETDYAHTNGTYPGD